MDRSANTLQSLWVANLDAIKNFLFAGVVPADKLLLMSSQPLQASQSSSSSLVSRLRARDAIAWSQLSDLYGPLVYFWCRQNSVPAADTVDVVQEVFLAVAKGIDGFQGSKSGGSFRGWLWTISRNKIRDFFRKASDVVAVGGSSIPQKLAQVPDIADELPDDDSHADHRREANALMHRAMAIVRNEFEQRTWDAFWRVVVDEHSTAEVAEDLGITANGVRQAKSRVLRRLREQLGDA